MMSPSDFARLLALSAIWGASFLFMRISAPAIGPVWTIAARVGLGAAFMLAVMLSLRRAFGIRQYWKNFLFLGAVNAAIPFLLFAYAALTLTASLLAILNATSPIWGALLAMLLGQDRLSPLRWFGLGLGLLGVILLTGIELQTLPAGAGVAVLAAVSASGCYSIGALYISRAAPVEPLANAFGSLWGASLWLLPVLLMTPLPTAVPGPAVLVSVFLLGILASGVAYLLYFRLIQQVGAVSTQTVTLLIPAFGVFWGHLFLQEAIGWHTLAGAALVLLGTGLATGYSPRLFLYRRR